MNDFQRQVADLSSQVGVIPVPAHAVEERTEKKTQGSGGNGGGVPNKPATKPNNPNSNPGTKTVPFKKPASNPNPSTPTPIRPNPAANGWKQRILNALFLGKGGKKGLSVLELEDFILRGFFLGAILLRCSILPGYPLHFLLPVLDRLLNPVPIVLILLVMGYLGFRFKRIWLERAFALGVVYAALAFLFPVIL